MKAKKETYALRTYYSPQKTWRVEDFDIRIMFYPGENHRPYDSRNLKLEYNILAGGDILNLNEMEVNNCDLYKTIKES